ncbi:HTH-type transcriptional regulator PgrR [Halomonadaceae bacterium LMG 33818]|uniref:LysR family transcriptional regulator n=1 Tax=Cernens ardua TaxID=3402176 RepID=UPI003EDBBA87
MNQLDEMRAFAAVVDTLSITEAAIRLGQSKQVISKRLQNLEARLGVRLLNRTTRRIHPTALGLEYAEQVNDILARIDDAERQVGLQRDTVRGNLRVTAPMSFTLIRLREVVAEFVKAHPEVSLTLELNDKCVDLLDVGFDMAIRVGDLADSSLVARRLCQFSTVTCASPEYLQKNAAPERLEQLHDHQCLAYGHQPQALWHFSQDQHKIHLPIKGNFHANNGEMLCDMAVAGLGITQLPSFIVEQALSEGKLVPVLEAFNPGSSAVSAVYPQHKEASCPMRAFIDFLLDKLEDHE